MPESGSTAISGGVADASGDTDVPPKSAAKRALEAVRSHLGMDVAYVSEFVDGRSVFREVDAPGHEDLVFVGGSNSLDDVYCRHILEGRIPELMPDTAAVPFAAAMPITQAAAIGAHISVPIRLPDGEPYGMFCCLSHQADPSLNQRDLQMMRAFAEMTAFEINREREAGRACDEKLARVRSVLDRDRLSISYQPIYNLEQGRIVGFECLSRFAGEPHRTPDLWFNEAAEVGLGPDLEIAAIRLALQGMAALPDVYLAVNTSPATLLQAELDDVLTGVPPSRIVLELTEHESVSDYKHLGNVLRPLRARGVRLAIDDAGAGYSSLRHILDLRPDLIKLDIGLTRNVDSDPARRALASALISFAEHTGSRIVAEGVETASELATLKTLGVHKAQGYLLGRPVSLADAVKLLAARERIAA